MTLAAIDRPKDTMSSQLVRRFREAVMSGDWAPGSKINLDRLRQDHDVSLSPLREALSRLTSDGLVEFADNRGYTVAPVSLSNLAEVTQLRAEVECLALRNAILTAGSAWDERVRAAEQRLKATVRDPTLPASFEAWEAAHNDLHLTLISGSGMPMLIDFCQRLMNLNDRYRRIFLRSQPGDRNVSQEHGEIAQSAIHREADFATALLRRHILRTGANLQSHLSAVLNN